MYCLKLGEGGVQRDGELVQKKVATVNPHVAALLKKTKQKTIDLMQAPTRLHTGHQFHRGIAHTAPDGNVILR